MKVTTSFFLIILGLSLGACDGARGLQPITPGPGRPVEPSHQKTCNKKGMCIENGDFLPLKQIVQKVQLNTKELDENSLLRVRVLILGNAYEESMGELLIHEQPEFIFSLFNYIFK